jgi:pimeloyl-ACP methyl ester carboxylesterase
MPLINLNNNHYISYQLIGDEKSTRTFFFIHGIMGKGRNLISFASKLVKEMPNTNGLLIDLRNHGESSKHNSPFSVEACADDIVEICSSLNISPVSIIGHSFGAKVALLSAHKLLEIKSVWLLDASLSSYKSQPLVKNNPTVMEIIEIMQEIKFPLENKNDLVKHLCSKNIELSVALWMSTNLEIRKNGFYLIFDLQEIKEMLKSFLELDLWQTAKNLGKRCTINFVKAQKSLRIDHGEIKKIELYLDGGSNLYELENAGHFLHSDNPQGLIEIISSNE